MILMMFKELITLLGTKDLIEASDFYQNILRLTIYKDQRVCLIFNIISQSKIGFCSHMSILHKDKNPILTFVAEEVDEIYNRLIEAGLNLTKKPKINHKFNIYHFFFKDPNDYTIEIQEFLE